MLVSGLPTGVGPVVLLGGIVPGRPGWLVAPFLLGVSVSACAGDGEEASAGTDLHVYTWAGELVAILRLDIAVRAVVIDSADRVGYGTRWEGDPAVVSFDLPPSLAIDTGVRQRP